MTEEKTAVPTKSPYELEMHESTYKGTLEIIRVPGGWIYSWAYGESSIIGVTMVFVPYSEEAADE